MRFLVKNVLRNLKCHQKINGLSNRNLSSSMEREMDESKHGQVYSHIPVMPKEVLQAFLPESNQIFLDMTFGAGGHSRMLLGAADIKLYCLDRDPVAYKHAKLLAEEMKNHQIIPLLGRFSELETLLSDVEVKKNSLDGIFIDAGCSSMQMDDPNRGFALSKNGPLDMRMDGDRYCDQPTAADVLYSLDYPSLVKIFKVYGEEKHSKKIAQALIDARYMLQRIHTTFELAEIVESALGCEQRFDRLHRSAHVATKVFQALRIFVNNELNELNYAAELAYKYLKPGGKLVTLCFHSLEDRIFKRHFSGIDIDEPVSKTLSQKYRNSSMWHMKEAIESLYSNRWKPLYKHVVKPSELEVASNPRSRSARFRAAVKCE